MCGIVGYLGKRDAVPLIVDGLRRLEYRGYDSAGIAVLTENHEVALRRASGKLQNLQTAIDKDPLRGSCGIGHTRWATHGRPTEENSHPHRDCSGHIVLVHNGIVENYSALKRQLTAEGHVFRTETDTEVLAHLVEKHWAGNLEGAVRSSLREVSGVFALAVISRSDPGTLVVARSGPPVVIGLGENEYFVASDVPAILSHTRDVYYLEDGDLAVLRADGMRLSDGTGCPISRPLSRIQWDPILAEKGGFKHFMLKEIFEQPRAIRDTMLGRLGFESGRAFLQEEVAIPTETLTGIKQVKIIACGTSWHAGLAGKFLIERLARLPVEVDYASEFRYRDPIVPPDTLTIVISQSGETADTLAALREARSKGSCTLAICNVVGSMITREANGALMTHAGPEIGVASTKAFTAQVTALLTLGLYLSQLRNTLSPQASLTVIDELSRVPGKVEQILQSGSEKYEELARHVGTATDFLYLGRGIHFPIALEGALKLKEISYIHAEGYPAGEMKHGPNALIDEKLPVVVLATRDAESHESQVHYEKTLSNMEEVRARSGIVIAIACEGDEEVSKLADHLITIPPTRELLLPLLEIVPLQLLAYHIAVRRGCDVDQPRNLAKSVTVE